VSGTIVPSTQREDIVEEGERNFRELADNAPVMVWRSGPDKLCDFFNEPWLRFTGRSMEQELGNGWAEGVHADDLNRCLAIYIDQFDRREEFSMDYRLRRHDGEYRWVLDNGRPYYRADGSFAGYFGSCIDITERKVEQAELEEALATTQGALREKDALLQELQHRVRNNFQIMLSLISIASEYQTDPVAREQLQQLQKRIHLVGSAQRLFHRSGAPMDVSCREVFRALAEALPKLGPIQCDETRLDVNQGTALALLLGELSEKGVVPASGTYTVQLRTVESGRARLSISCNTDKLRRDKSCAAIVNVAAGLLDAPLVLNNPVSIIFRPGAAS
jgi:two-component system, sensor histidine kinase PdtaS